MKKLTGEESVMSNFFSDGLTIRQYYAGLAMQGLLANGAGARNLTLDGIRLPMIKFSVDAADALIAELNEDATTE